MDIFDSQPQSISYGEYQTTSSKGIKSQAYENENISNNLENYELASEEISHNNNLNEIIPVKILPSIDEGNANNTKINMTSENIDNDINLKLNTFDNTTESFPNLEFENLKPTSTLDIAQTFENKNLVDEINLPETIKDLNTPSQSYESSIVDTTSNLQTQTFETKNELTQEFNSNNIQVINTENTFNLENLQNSEPIIDATITTTNDNFDLDTLTTTNIEANQDFDSIKYQTNEISSSFENQVIPEKINIDTNIYQTSEPIIDTTTTTSTENLDLINITSQNAENNDVNQVYDINNINQEEPIVETATINKNDNLDLNTYITTNKDVESKIETNQEFEISEFPESKETTSYDNNIIPEETNIDTNIYQTSEPIIDTNITTENYDITNIETNQSLNINTFQASEPIVDATKTITSNNYDLTTLPNFNTETTKTIDDEIFKAAEVIPIPRTTKIEADSYQTNEITSRQNFDLTNLETNFDINTSTESNITKSIDPAIVTIISTDVESTPSLNINTLPTPTLTIPKVESTPSFDINDLSSTPQEIYKDKELQINDNSVKVTNITNLDTQNIEISNDAYISENSIPAIDTTSALQMEPTFDIKPNLSSPNTEYKESNNAIDNTSILPMTTRLSELDTNNLLTSTTNIDNTNNINIENNNYDSFTFQTTMETRPLTFETTSSKPIFDINSFMATNNETSTKETYNTTNYQTSTTTEVQNYTPEINFNEYQISRTKHNKAGSISEPNLASFEKIQTPIPTLQKKFNLKETKSILIPNVKIPHPQFAQKDEIIYSVVTPLKTNISNNVPGGMVAKVSVVKHFGTATYRPGADDNKKKLNTGNANKKLIRPKEYRTKTFNPNASNF